MASPVAEAIPEEAAPPTPVYRGDVYGFMIWISGALILVALHIIDVVYWWLHG